MERRGTTHELRIGVPKLAITVLSGIDSSRLVTAIRSGDHATLTRIPGIGKKTAERVVLELKDKLDDLAVSTPATAGTPHHGPAGDDALSALVNLGYARPIAQKAIETAMLAVLTRRPSDEEEQYFTRRLAQSTGPQRARRLGDLYWTMLNSTEFSWNH